MPLIAMTEDEKEAALEGAASDLKFLMSEVGVSAAVQAAVFHKGFNTLCLYAGMDESRVEVRAALTAEIGLDHTQGGNERRSMALLLSVWDTARTQLKYDDEAKADARNNTFPRVVPVNDFALMREALEDEMGPLRDSEVPAKSFLSMKLEDVEMNIPRVEDLRDVIMSAGQMRLRPNKTTVTLPTGPEELRLRHRRLGIVWCMARTRHRNRVHQRGPGASGQGSGDHEPALRGPDYHLGSLPGGIEAIGAYQSASAEEEG